MVIAPLETVTAVSLRCELWRN